MVMMMILMIIIIINDGDGDYLHSQLSALICQLFLANNQRTALPIIMGSWKLKMKLLISAFHGPLAE